MSDKYIPVTWIVCAMVKGQHIEKEFTSYEETQTWDNTKYQSDIDEFPCAAKAYTQSGGNVKDIYAIYRTVYEQVKDEDGDDMDNREKPIGRRLEWHTNGIKVYLNMYRVTQGYGGPQEGGWWFDCWEPEEDSCEVFTMRQSPLVHPREFYADRQEEMHKDFEEAWVEANGRQHRPASSAAGDGFDISVRIESTPAESGDNYRPWC